MPFDLKTGIVRILAADGATTTGTGFILSEKGVIATCSHVIQPEKLQVRGYPRPEKVEVIFRANGQRAVARLLPQAWRAAEAEDVAFLQLEGPLPPGVAALSIGTSEGGAGHAFQSFGFPDQSPEEGIYGEGRLLDQTAILGIRVLQVKSSEITPGFSGAPVFDTESRRVVGMVTSIAAPDKFGRLAETAFITPAETLISIYPELVASDVRPYMGLSPFTEKGCGVLLRAEAAGGGAGGGLAGQAALPPGHGAIGKRKIVCGPGWPHAAPAQRLCAGERSLGHNGGPACRPTLR